MRKILLVILFLGVLFKVPAYAQPASPSSSSSLKEETEFTAAVVKEQKVTFAVVIVKRAVLDDKKFSDALIDELGPSFGDIPVVLMAQDLQGTPTYYGRTDISKFLSTVPLGSIPWKQYTLKPQVQ